MDMQYEKSRWKKVLHRAAFPQLLLLWGMAAVLCLLPLGTTYFFGSDGDWLSQHVAIADSLRQAMLEQHTLIPQYISLGGGSSVYDFSYYGILRPDVLFSCLIPHVKMKYVIAGYQILELFADITIFFYWLRSKKIRGWHAFGGAFLFLCATCLGQAHHQIMFINYMPFLLLALFGIDRILQQKGMGLFVISLFFIYIHSFYYAISCLVVLLLYAIHGLMQQKQENGCDRKRQRRILLEGFAGVAISIGMAMVVLLPTGLDILSTSKDGGKFAQEGIGIFSGGMAGLLYVSYGCGLTLISLYCLLLCIWSKRKRFLAAAILVSVLFPVITLVLNGFLYARSKVLIPFTPVAVWLVADTLQALWKKEERHRPWLLLGAIVPLVASSWKLLIVMEMVGLGIWILLQKREWKKNGLRKAVFAMVWIAPFCINLCVNAGQPYFKYGILKIPYGGGYLARNDTRQEHFEVDEVEKVVTDPAYRMDITANYFTNSNMTLNGSIQRTTMYSSVSNAGYSSFFYDTIKNAMPVNNRVALPSQSNPFFNYFMGVKYVLTEEENVPAGYTVKAVKNGYVLAEKESDAVLPVCYATTDWMSRTTFDQIAFPDNLPAITNHTIVEDGVDHFEQEDGTGIAQEDVADIFTEESIAKLKNAGAYTEETVLSFKQDLSHQIMILQCKVARKQDTQEVELTLNGVRNKLSSVMAPYPNENDTFTYIFEIKEGQTTISMLATPGDYTIGQITCYTMPAEKIHHEDVMVPTLQQPENLTEANVYAGSVTMPENGYFVTTFPYRDGYQVTVDGKAVSYACVNTTFVGFPLDDGQHEIRIGYTAPGYRMGRMLSVISCVLFGIMELILCIIQHKTIRKSW